MRLCAKYFTSTTSWWSSPYSRVRWCYWLVSYFQIPFACLIQSLIFSLSRFKWFSNNSLYTDPNFSILACKKDSSFFYTPGMGNSLPQENPLIHVCLHTCYPFCLSLFKVSCIWRISGFFKSYFNCFFSCEPFPGFLERNYWVPFPPCLQSTWNVLPYSTGRGRGREKKRKSSSNNIWC